MIMTFVLILSFLVALNFFLLYFSCNKTPIKESDERLELAEKGITQKITAKRLPSAQLAPTGS